MLHKKPDVLYFTCHSVFALISTDFVCWGCYFTWITTMHMTFFHILLTNLWKCLAKIHFLPWSNSRQKSPQKEKVSLRGYKSIFLKHFQRLVNNVWKNFMCIVVLHVKLQPQQTTSVEMRANFVWQVKIIDFSMYFLINSNY